MSDLKNIAKVIAETSSKDTTSAYDTTATVIRLDGGVAYVHIDGGVTETPADMTISCQAGDSVKIRVAGGKAWITGNVTAPPTDDREAKVAQLVANSAINTASNAQDVADTAQSTADSAKTAADTAQGTANAANSNAQSAQRSANQANSAVSNLETTLTKEIQETTEGWQAVFKRVGMYDADADNPSDPENPESSTSTKVSISEDGLVVEGNSGADSIKTTVKNGIYGVNKNNDDIFHLDQQGVHTGRAYLDNGYECVGLKMVPITVDGVNYLIYIKSGGSI